MISPYVYPGINQLVRINEKGRIVSFDESRNEMYFILKSKFGIDKRTLRSRCKRRTIAEVRQLAYYILYYKYNSTLEEVAFELERTHGTIINGIRSFRDLYDTDPNYKSTANEILNRMGMVYVKEK